MRNAHRKAAPGWLHHVVAERGKWRVITAEGETYPGAVLSVFDSKYAHREADRLNREAPVVSSRRNRKPRKT